MKKCLHCMLHKVVRNDGANLGRPEIVFRLLEVAADIIAEEPYDQLHGVCREVGKKFRKILKDVESGTYKAEAGTRQ